jgi:hypothetical protein
MAKAIAHFEEIALVILLQEQESPQSSANTLVEACQWLGSDF